MNEIQGWLADKLLALNLTDTMNRPDGFTRLGYSPEETLAHQKFRKIAQELGLKTYQDNAGNQWAVWETGFNSPTIAVGSHLDTVINGGGYDGVAGVLSGLGAIKMLKDLQFQPGKNIAVICFASEESARFGVSTIGSKTIAGMLDKEETGQITDRDGISVKEAVNSFGLDWDTIEEAELSAEKLESFLELHIEQSPRLEEKGADIGIVDGIACPVRLKVKVKGAANHTGTTAMDNRQDALVAIAPLVNYVSEKAAQISQQQEQPLVATVSTIELWPNAMNVIPGEVELGIDIRSVSDSIKRNFAEQVRRYCQEVALDKQVKIDVTTLVDNESVLLDRQIQQKLANIAEELGYKYFSMNSGAGHDVMNMAKKWPSGLVFIPCKDGISHHPEEYASVEDIAKGTEMIAHYLQFMNKDSDK